ncbi:MAG: gamma-glutamyltransferase [Fimbriimonas sp.]
MLPPRCPSLTLADNGMVATTHPLAAQIGLDVLKSGGNAIDAAIATNAALTVMEPCNCGIGGDLFALVWDSESKRLYGLNGSGRAPLAASIDHFLQQGHTQIPRRGPLAISVPGCVEGWQQLNQRFGTRPLGDLLEPAIVAAESGVPVPQTIAKLWARSEDLLRATPEATATFLPDNRVPTEGSRFVNPRLAATLRALQAEGASAFYQGVLSEQIVKSIQKAGGVLALEDLERHSSTWVDPISTCYRGYDVWQIPPNGQGLTVLQMLNILENFDLSSLSHESSEFWHILLEAKKLAYSDRASYYADPAYADVPLQQLLSKEYARKQASRIDPLRASQEVPSGDIDLSESDTIYLTVVDKDRNWVSLIQSNYLGFGSGIMAGDLGFMFQNRGLAFNLDPKHPNALAPGKRPFHTIIPGFVTKDNQPWLSFGVMGGDMQPQGQVQVLVNLIDLGYNLQEAGDAPRIEHTGSATPEGIVAQGGGTLIPELLISSSTLQGLRDRGHEVSEPALNSGSFQGIMIHPESGVLVGASESRRDGQAVGY